MVTSDYLFDAQFMPYQVLSVKLIKKKIKIKCSYQMR